jgi:hypothetical protein
MYDQEVMEIFRSLTFAGQAVDAVVAAWLGAATSPTESVKVVASTKSLAIVLKRRSAFRRCRFLGWT